MVIRLPILYTAGASHLIKVPDDSGFLAVVVPAAYDGFVSNHWELHHLFLHFSAQMYRRALLLWGTGLEGLWRVEVRTYQSEIHGFREISGPIRVTGGLVLITSYESLTMAAQFENVTLPEPHERDQLVPLPDGDYCCRVVQMFDPEGEEGSANSDGPDFVIEFTRVSALPPEWSKVPWSQP